MADENSMSTHAEDLRDQGAVLTHVLAFTRHSCAYPN